MPGEGTTCPSARAAVAASAAALCCGATPPGLVLNASVVGICDCWPPDEAGVAAIAHVRAGPSVGSGGLVPRASCMVWGIAGGGAVGSARRIHQELSLISHIHTHEFFFLSLLPITLRAYSQRRRKRGWALLRGITPNLATHTHAFSFAECGKRRISRAVRGSFFSMFFHCVFLTAVCIIR